jgi:hypothetical protein
MAACSKITPMVVVPTCTQEWISRCLDSGAQAIVVPLVNNVDEALIYANASKFPPLVITTRNFLSLFPVPSPVHDGKGGRLPLAWDLVSVFIPTLVWG